MKHIEHEKKVFRSFKSYGILIIVAYKMELYTFFGKINVLHSIKGYIRYFQFEMRSRFRVELKKCKFNGKPFQ